MNARHLLLVIGLAVALIVINLGIASRERLLRDGDIVFLQLAPVDPRSLMQGDYMALDFAIAQDVRAALGDDVLSDGHHDGYAVLALAADRTSNFVREQPGVEPLSPGEIALRYRLRGGQPRIVTNAWFFPEGQADRYQPARYGELRIGADGEALLVALRDANLRPL